MIRTTTRHFAWNILIIPSLCLSLWLYTTDLRKSKDAMVSYCMKLNPFIIKISIMNGLINGCMDGLINGYMDGFINGCMDGLIDRWMDGWMND